MGQVRLLPEEVQKAIRAGEVVERPASVLKELLENAIDAEARQIRVEVLSAGTGLIRVSDDGNGILSEDLPLCIQRHTTSKISSKEDLYRITTMGFRGEALYSIASVSKMKIISQARQEPVGAFIEVHGGRIIAEGPASTVGTIVEVRDLFYNTPARRKFLKSYRTELYHIITVFQEAALCNPTISFTLSVQRQETLFLPGTSSLRERLLQIFGQDLINNALETSIEGVHLFINPSVRQSRPPQFISVNSRPVQDRIIRSAITQALKDTSISEPRETPYFIFLSLSPEEVDFNVHPQKREVKFRDEQRVFKRIYHTVKETLLQEERKKVLPQSPGHPVTTVTGKYQGPDEPQPVTMVKEEAPDYGHLQYRFLPITPGFFCFSDGQALYILDQHAAHERLMYEKLTGSLECKTQNLLFPRQVQLPAREFEAVKEALSVLKEMGIEAEVFGERTLLIRSLPEDLYDTSLEEILSDTAKRLLELHQERPSIDDLRDEAAKTIACHRSVRANQSLSEPEMRTLVQQLQRAKEPTRCPHGRPTMVKFSLEDLEKLFGRR